MNTITLPPGYFRENVPVGVSTPLIMRTQGGEIFRVLSDGSIVSDGIDITDDSAALANCFCDLLKRGHGITIRGRK